MTNIQKLAAEGNKNHRIFAATIVDLMNSQGFYGRLYFKDSLDVVLWLEC